VELPDTESDGQGLELPDTESDGGDFVLQVRPGERDLGVLDVDPLEM
jgi:hypothetical protein